MVDGLSGPNLDAPQTHYLRDSGCYCKTCLSSISFESFLKGLEPVDFINGVY